MTEKEIKVWVKKAKRFMNKTLKTENGSRDFLIKAGICTRKGNLRKPYNGKI